MDMDRSGYQRVRAGRGEVDGAKGVKYVVTERNLTVGGEQSVNKCLTVKMYS